MSRRSRSPGPHVHRPSIRRARPRPRSGPYIWSPPYYGLAANYSPTYYNYYDEDDYSDVDGQYDAPTKVDPTYLIGKILVRLGQQPYEMTAKGYISENDAKKYIWEKALPTPYQIIPAGGTTYGSNPTRLLVFLDSNGVITNAMYG